MTGVGKALFAGANGREWSGVAGTAGNGRGQFVKGRWDCFQDSREWPPEIPKFDAF